MRKEKLQNETLRNQCCLSKKKVSNLNIIKSEFTGFSGMKQFFSIFSAAVTFSAYSFVWQTKEYVGLGETQNIIDRLNVSN
jgi:hypothetical protein